MVNHWAYSIHSLFLLRNCWLYPFKLLLCQQDNHLNLCLNSLLLCFFLTCANSTFKSIIWLNCTCYSNASLMTARLTKLVENEITAYSVSTYYTQGNCSSFLTFHYWSSCSSSSSFSFKPSSDLATNSA